MKITRYLKTGEPVETLTIYPGEEVRIDQDILGQSNEDIAQKVAEAVGSERVRKGDVEGAKKIKRLSCPFCDSGDIYLCVGKGHKGTRVAFCRCYFCGAQGPSTPVGTVVDSEEYEQITSDWNKRIL